MSLNSTTCILRYIHRFLVFHVQILYVLGMKLFAIFSFQICTIYCDLTTFKKEDKSMTDIK